MTKPEPGPTIGEQAAAGAFWNTLGFACMSLCGYVIAVLLARGFGPVAFGVYGVVYSVLLASEQILRLGIPQALTRLIGGSTNSDQSALEATGVWLGVSVSVAGFVVLWVAAPLLAEWLQVPDGVRLFHIAILDIPFFCLFRVLTHILGGRRDFKATGLITCAHSLARAGGIAVLVATDRLSVEGALIVNVVASIVGVLLITSRAGPKAFRVTLSERTTILSAALPITVGDIGIQVLLGIDLWLLSVLGTSLATEVRGEYVAAMSLARGPNLLAFVLVAVLVPLIARATSTGEHAAARRLVLGTTRFLVVFVVPACALIAANAEELMSLFFGQQYRSGALYLGLLVFAQGLGYTVLAALQAITIGTGHAANSARHIYGGLTAGVALNVVLIPRFGAAGAAVAALLSFAVTVLLTAGFVRSTIGALIDARQAALALAASLGVAAVAWLVPSAGGMTLVELSVLGIIYLGVAWSLGLIDARDWALVRGKSAG